MPNDHRDGWAHIDNRFDIDERHAWWPWFCPKPTVRILFYTDDPTVNLSYAPDFGVGRLRDLLVGHNTFHANIQVDLVYRHDGGHAANLLTAALLKTYDQLWVFGVLQCNLPGQPANELTGQEIADLRAWMDGGGGLLITGDHSNPDPRHPGDPNFPPLNLGRALGEGIPRAGELRTWVGLPDASPVNNHNTQVPDGVHNINDLFLQGDAVPQRLTLKKYWAGWTLPIWIRRFRPHPLFCGRSGPIEVFPDHMHEGQLVIPAAFPAATWPSGPTGQPVPEIVAWGTDKRTNDVYGITTAYDGALAGVGRIVADATWHHYFNVNLAGFANPSATLDTIADYYVNLAIWLSPPNKQAQMRCRLWWDVATHPSVRMVAGNSLYVIGATALDVLGRHTTTCLITEFAWPWPILLAERERFPWPPEELLLGGVIKQYHQAFYSAVTDPPEEAPSRGALVRAGVIEAIDTHAEQLHEAAAGAAELRAVAEQKFDRE
jgi:hypothetical protein